MNPQQFLHDYSEFLVNFTFIVSLLFPIVIALFWKWWESDWGTNIVILELGIAVTIFPSVLFIDWGIDFTILHWLQAIGLTVVPLVIIHRAYLIIKTQLEGAAQQQEEKREDPDAIAGHQ